MADVHFTRGAQRVLSQAGREAAELRHDIIGTEHVLLALLDVPEADLVTTFSRVGMEPGQVRSTTLTMLGLSPEEQSADRTLAVEDVPELPHTHRINDVIECAIVEARDLNTASVTATCLLLGLLRERHGVAAEALARHGITVEMVRDAVQAQ